MNQLFYLAPGRLEWREVSDPELEQETDVVVRPLAVATCDLDTALLEGIAPFEGPFPLGHEGVAEVVAVGDAVSQVRVGQRVIIPFQISCGSCDRCRRRLTGSCASVELGAMYGLEPFGGSWGGFLADLVRVPWADHMLVPLPVGMNPVTVASMSDNIPDAWRTVAPFLDDPVRSSVLIMGGGGPSVAFYTIGVARALGVERVDYIDDDADRLAKAERLGADVSERGDASGRDQYTVTVCSTQRRDALVDALAATEPDGTCVCNAIFFEGDVPLPMLSMYTKGVRLVTGRVNARTVIPSALALVSGGRLAPELVTDDVVEWADAAAALVDQPRKIVVHRSEGDPSTAT